jgi:glycosyltransferase involved in cell wall biosynthesis
MTSTICLNMIVKNEAHVIERCLASVKPFIDYWVIVDTGSSDGTQGVITNFMADVPGELHERPWRDFAHNRTDALTLARGKADYVFILDADEVLVIEDAHKKGELDLDSYLVQMYSGGVAYWRTLLVSNRLAWRYVGVLHEYIDSDEKQTEAELRDVHVLRFTDGARSRDPTTYRRDTVLLQQGLIDEPDNERYVFYLAQSYRDAGDLEMAVKTYERRVAMGRWDEEVWYSLYQIAALKATLRHELPSVVMAYLEAFRYRPTRAEPMYRLAMMFQDTAEHHLANLFLARAIEIPLPADRLFVERAVYDHLAALEYAVSAYYVGDDAEAIRVNNALLSRPDLPGELFLRVLENRRFSLDRRAPEIPARDPPPAVFVLVHVSDPGPLLDNCVESLADQDDRANGVFAGAPGFEQQIPDDDRFTTVATEGAADPVNLLSVAIDGDDDDVVLLLDGRDWLADDGAIGRVAGWFRSHDCLALVGQYRYASGEYGLAMPFHDRASFEAPNRAHHRTVALACRLGLWRHASRFASDLTGADRARSLADALLDLAGFERTHFTDEVLVVRDIEFDVDERGREARPQNRTPLQPMGGNPVIGG